MKNDILFPKVRFEEFSNTWNSYELGKISDITKLAGFEFTKYVRYSSSGHIIAVRGLNVRNNKLVLNDLKYIDNSDFSKLERSKLFKNDLLFTYVGTVGEIAKITENNKYYLAPNVARIRVNENVNPDFVTHSINNVNFYNHIIVPLISSSSQPALSMRNIRKFRINFPKI